MKNILENKNYKLLQGDCLELMKDISDKSIDMILCDLPYGTTQCKWDSVIPFESLWEQYNRIIKDNGAVLLFGSEPFSSYLRMSNIKNYKRRVFCSSFLFDYYRIFFCFIVYFFQIPKFILFRKTNSIVCEELIFFYPQSV